MPQCGLGVLPCLHAPSVAGVASSHTTVGGPVNLDGPHGVEEGSLSAVTSWNLRSNSIRSLIAAPSPAGGLASPHSCALRQFRSLSTLDLTNNELATLEGIDCLPFLRVLRVGRNYIEDLSPLWQSAHISMLEKLDVSANRLDTFLSERETAVLQAHAARAGLQLQHLNLSGNRIQQISRHVSLFPRLETLRARRNRIAAVASSFPSAHCCPAIQTLDLSFNNLTATAVDAVRRRAEQLAEVHILQLEGNVGAPEEVVAAPAPSSPTTASLKASSQKTRDGPPTREGRPTGSSRRGSAPPSRHRKLPLPHAAQAPPPRISFAPRPHSAPPPSAGAAGPQASSTRGTPRATSRRCNTIHVPPQRSCAAPCAKPTTAAEVPAGRRSAAALAIPSRPHNVILNGRCRSSGPTKCWTAAAPAPVGGVRTIGPNAWALDVVSILQAAHSSVGGAVARAQSGAAPCPTPWRVDVPRVSLVLQPDEVSLHPPCVVLTNITEACTVGTARRLLIQCIQKAIVVEKPVPVSRGHRTSNAHDALVAQPARVLHIFATPSATDFLNPWPYLRWRTEWEGQWSQRGLTAGGTAYVLEGTPATHSQHAPADLGNKFPVMAALSMSMVSIPLPWHALYASLQQRRLEIAMDASASKRRVSGGHALDAEEGHGAPRRCRIPALMEDSEGLPCPLRMPHWPTNWMTGIASAPTSVGRQSSYPALRPGGSPSNGSHPLCVPASRGPARDYIAAALTCIEVKEEDAKTTANDIATRVSRLLVASPVAQYSDVDIARSRALLSAARSSSPCNGKRGDSLCRSRTSRRPSTETDEVDVPCPTVPAVASLAIR